MPKLIGIKELQTNTRAIREQVCKGAHFIVIYRSKPVFEIRPLSDQDDWSDRDRYILFEHSMKDWHSPDDDNLFDESVSL